MQTGSRDFIFDSRGRPVLLGKELGKGGEGVVYEVAGDPATVVKLYTNEEKPQLFRKLEALTLLATPQLAQIGAWPTSTVYRNKKISGFLMPRVRGEPIHQLYSPASMKIKFPSATNWRFLVHTARNVAAAFSIVHETNNIVIGDVNQNNILVSERGEVKFIDCDSVQITMGNLFYPCEVAISHFTPAELMGRSLEGTRRSQNHDNFGLAVLVFHLLFLGRHPFAGTYLGPGEMPIERAIAEGRFAYGRTALRRQMKQPPHSLSLSVLPGAMADMFEAAFDLRAVSQARPTARDWLNVLDKLRNGLTQCAVHKDHVFPNIGANCLWCEIETKGGPIFFITVGPAISEFEMFDLATLWEKICAVQTPNVNHPLLPAMRTEAVVGKPLPGNLIKLRRIARFAIILELFSSTFRRELSQRRLKLRDIEDQLRALSQARERDELIFYKRR